MTKKTEPGPILARFDEHGMFELDAEMTQTVGGGWPPLVEHLRERVHDLLNQGTGNHTCIAPNLSCGGNTLCG